MAPKSLGEPTLTVGRAARILGVHPNTVRSWSDQGRLPFLRINARGDRRYRPADLSRFLDEAAQRPEQPARQAAPAHRAAPAVLPIGPDVVEERTRPHELRGFALAGQAEGGRAAAPAYARFVRLPPGGPAGRDGSPGATPGPSTPWSGRPGDPEGSGAGFGGGFGGSFDGGFGGWNEPGLDAVDRRRATAELAILATLLAGARPGGDPLELMTLAVEQLHDRAGHDLVAVLERSGGALVPRVARGVGANRLGRMPVGHGLPARALREGATVVETAPPPHVEEWLAPGRLLHGRIIAPIGFGVVWGLLVVGDEGSAAARDWAPVVDAVARVLGLALAVAGGGHVNGTATSANGGPGGRLVPATGSGRKATPRREAPPRREPAPARQATPASDAEPGPATPPDEGDLLPLA